MSAAREQILAGIRKSLGRGKLEGAAAEAVEARLKGHERILVPKRSDGDQAHKIGLFVEMAEAVSCTVDRLDSLESVPERLADYLRRENLPARIKQSPALEDTVIPWEKAPALEITSGAAVNEDAVGLTPAHAGIAETGTLMLHSSAETPTSLHFVPDTHVVLLRESQIVGAYEDAWDMLRQKLGLKPGASVPRTVNLVTGPSRTGDVEQIIQLGAHGPRRLHIMLVKD